MFDNLHRFDAAEDQLRSTLEVWRSIWELILPAFGFGCGLPNLITPLVEILIYQLRDCIALGLKLLCVFAFPTLSVLFLKFFPDCLQVHADEGVGFKTGESRGRQGQPRGASALIRQQNTIYAPVTPSARHGPFIPHTG